LTRVEGKADYDIYHRDFSSAVQHAEKNAQKRGFKVDEDDWANKVAHGSKKPSSGKTNSYSIDLTDKSGKPSRKKLHMQVYNMDNKKYELNMYIESVEQVEESTKLTVYRLTHFLDKKTGKIFLLYNVNKGTKGNYTTIGQVVVNKRENPGPGEDKYTMEFVNKKGKRMSMGSHPKPTDSNIQSIINRMASKPKLWPLLSEGFKSDMKESLDEGLLKHNPHPPGSVRTLHDPKHDWHGKKVTVVKSRSKNWKKGVFSVSPADNSTLESDYVSHKHLRKEDVEQVDETSDALKRRYLRKHDARYDDENYHRGRLNKASAKSHKDRDKALNSKNPFNKSRRMKRVAKADAEIANQASQYRAKDKLATKVRNRLKEEMDEFLFDALLEVTMNEVVSGDKLAAQLAKRKAQRLRQKEREKKSKQMAKSKPQPKPDSEKKSHTQGSRSSSKDHIIMQLRRAQDVHNNIDKPKPHMIKVSPTREVEVTIKQIDAILKLHDAMNKPDQKRKFRIDLIRKLRAQKKR
jgi:hypothetical protein